MVRAKDSFTSSFDYSLAIEKICIDLCMRLPVFSSIRMEQVGVSICQTRCKEQYGVFASVTPLRFEGGLTVCKRSGRYFKIPLLMAKCNKPLLYILSIFLPRFQDQPTLQEKLGTLVHELYHISPNFDGDIRRFNGRCYAHGSSTEKYNQAMERYVKEWLDKDPPPELWSFLKFSFKELQTLYGNIKGQRYSNIKMISVSAEEAALCLKSSIGK